MARIDAQSLIPWCRALKHGLDIGLSPTKVFRQQGKTGPTKLRIISNEIADRVEDGDSITESLKIHASSFPTLFLELVSVGEKSGRLPDIFGELEKHYEAVVAAQRQFRNSMIKPVATYVIATIVLTLLIFILGQLPSVSGRAMDPLGLGLSGSSGALIFLVFAVGLAAVVVFSAWVVVSSENLQSKFAGMVLNVPVIGSCLRNFALSRFCLTMHATIEAGMKGDESLRSSLKSTSNEQYSSLAATAAKTIRKGDELAETLAGYGPKLFPDSLIQTITLGEETGRLAEILQKESVVFREEAHRQLNLVVMIVSRLIYAMVALLVIVAIYKVFSNSIGVQYQEAFDAVDNPDKWMRGGR